MKKKIMIGAFAALFLSVGVLTATNLQEKEKVSDLTLANIEAMTFGGNDERELEIDSTPTCRWHYIGKKNTGCLVGGGGNRCSCGETTFPIS